MKGDGWRPDIARRAGPRYAAIAEALADDIRGGLLPPGTRLPTHRALARRLGVNVGTVTRAYAEAERRGLVEAQVGRGTFVRDGAAPPPGGAVSASPPGPIVDLAASEPVIGPQGRALADYFAARAEGSAAAPCLAPRWVSGAFEHRAAGVRWLARHGLDVPLDRVVVTAGGQHALVTALAALAGPGDVVLTEALTYPGLGAAATLLRLTVHGVLMDADGLRPDSLELACLSTGARVLYCTPTLHNPTTATMPEERRRAVIDVAARHGLTVIEDHVLAPLAADAPPPLAALAPDRCCLIASFSKIIAPGLRLGFLAAPANLADVLERGVRATVRMAAPLMADIAAAWIADGTADRLLDWQRREITARAIMAAEIMGALGLRTRPGCPHAWLPLPEPWRADDLVHEARLHGVAVSPAALFAAGRGAPPQAVRLGFGPFEARERLKDAVARLAALVRDRPRPRFPRV